ncbi:15299_t:CDS:2 [Dentiscutata erythropus]|uniref:15299_t:CDS:1 n=1 Tax=Dentiscutata erythropus TaxID=1348616 RepID=A0A9N9GDI9_9GLOM|nr:15299_t:CDS:2 [Dentiscutata erythropus]
MSSQNDYLAKKYGSISKTTKKTKKSAKPNAIIDEDEMLNKWKADELDLERSERERIMDSRLSVGLQTADKVKKDLERIEKDRKMDSGLSVGLQTADKVKKDLERIDKEAKDKFRTMDPSRSGRGAQTVYRDKHGKKIDIVAQRAEERRKIEEEEKHMKWGNEDQIVKEDELRHKPLAIYKDDKELNEEQKAQERWDDPAALFLTKKRKKKESSRPKYQGPPPPPNRFNIPPGYRWDGIDRSNGFEKAYFEKLNTRSALASEAYSWSVEDM